MTISPESCQRIPAAVVVGNFETLGAFEKGDKPVTRENTLSKENRLLLPVVRRALEGAFDPQVLENTFISACEICQKAENPYLHKRPEELMADARTIKRLAVGALRGLKEAENTYRNEAKTAYWKNESKTLTAEKLQRIYDTYFPILSPKKRSVTALISVFESGQSSSASLPDEIKQQSQASSARAFWKMQDRKVSCVEEALQPKVVSVTIQELAVIAEEPVPPPPKEKISVPKRRVTTILRRMAQDTLDQVRLRKKKKKKPYKEKSFIRLFTKGKKKPASTVTEELAQFGGRSEEISKRYEHFESHQQGLRRQRHEEEKNQQVSCFDLTMLNRVYDDYDGVHSDNSNHSSWNDLDEQVFYMRREVIQQAQKRPLTRSVSVYQGPVGQHKMASVSPTVKPSHEDTNLRERLNQIRTHTQYSYSGDDRTEDDYFSDEDLFDEDLCRS